MKKHNVAVAIAGMSFLAICAGGEASATNYTVDSAQGFADAVAEIHAGSGGNHTIALGSDIAFDSTNSSTYSSAITFDNNNTVTILGNNHTLTLATNAVKLNVSNATLNLGSSSATNALTIAGAGADVDANGSLIHLTNSTLNMYDGVTLTGNKIGGGSSACGGAVRVASGASFIMNGGTITDNHYQSSAQACGGGAIEVDGYNGSTFTMNGGTISNNTSNFWGGAIHAAGDSEVKVTINGGTLSGNTAPYGAAVALQGESSLTAKRAVFSNNGGASTGYGGAILNYENSAVDIVDSTFNGNGATHGGAVFTWGATASIAGSTFKDNSASYGGAIRNQNKNAITLSNNTFSGNSASANGGAIYSSKPITSAGDIITENTADNIGGGVYLAGSNEYIFSTALIYNNKAASQANDAYIDSASTATLINAASMNKYATFDDQEVFVNAWFADDDTARYTVAAPTTIVSSTPTGTKYYLTAAYDPDGAQPASDPVTPDTAPENPATDDNIYAYVLFLGACVVVLAFAATALSPVDTH
jgi:predicted outer membrane repeat protein